MNLNNKSHKMNPSSMPWVARHKIIFIFGVLLLAALFQLFLLFPIMGYLLHPVDYRKHLAALRAEGLPVNAQDVEIWHKNLYSDIPCESWAFERAPETAVGVYLRAFKVASSVYDKNEWLQIEALLDCFPKESGFNAGEIDTAVSFLEKHQMVLDHLHQAVNFPPGQFCLDYSRGMQMEMPHYNPLNRLILLLETESIISLHQGNAEATFHSLLAVLGLLKPLDTEILISSRLLQLVGLKRMFQVLNEIIASVDLNDTQLTEMQKGLESLKLDVLFHTLSTERAFGIQLFQETIPALRETKKLRDHYFVQPLTNILVNHYFARDLSCFLESMEELIQASRLPWPAAKVMTDRVEMNFKNDRILPSISEKIIPVYCKAVDNLLGIGEARRIVCFTAVAIERYRLAHGVLPDDLAELVPTFIDRLPEDPFDLKPLRYFREENGYCLYSIGENASDDDGIRPGKTLGGDIMFRVGY